MITDSALRYRAAKYGLQLIKRGDNYTVIDIYINGVVHGPGLTAEAVDEFLGWMDALDALPEVLAEASN